MALLTASALGKTIRENDIDSLYYFYGHDTAALESFTKRLVNKLCPADAQVMNFHKLDGKNLDFPMLTDACEALPFMAERVVVTINDLNIDAVTKDDLDDLKKILGSLGETTTVIIYATGVDLFKNKKYLTDKNKRFADFCEKHGTVCNFEYKRASDLGKSISTYLAKSGCTITKSNAEYLANLCLCDTAFISKELEKLFLLDGRNIRRKISALRQDGFPICSDETGYYYADNQKEINTTVCRLNELVTKVSNARTGLLFASILGENAQTVEVTIKVR